MNAARLTAKPGLPEWAETVRRKYVGGEASVFLLYGNVFDEIKSNAAARRLLSQMMHPNEQVRERAFEGLVRLVREDDKQRALMELLEPLMEDLGSGDQATQDEAREEIRKLLEQYGCNDGQGCTRNDVCTNGVCGGTSYSCTPTMCQASSTCDGNGGCTVANKPDNTQCSDGDACTYGDVCRGGVCTARTASGTVESSI